jgi:uncharacterized protein
MEAPVAQTTRTKGQVQNQAELIETLRTELPTLRERYAIRTLALFGSYARGTPHARSDLDLLVEFDRVPSLLTYVEIEQRLTDLVGVKVDLVMKRALKPAIGRRILAELVPV